MYFDKLANGEDEATGAAFEVYVARKVGGGAATIQIARELCGSPETLYRKMLGVNAELPPDRRSALLELGHAIEQEAREQWLYAKAGGWRDEQAAFLLGDKLIGDAGGIKVFPPGGMEAPASLGIERCGSLAGWQRKLAEPALAFPPYVAAIAAAFAAPLAHPCSWPNYRLHCFGGASSRRALAVALAGAPVGLVQEHIARLSRLSASEVPLAGQLMTDLVVPVLEHDDALANGQSRSRSGMLADRLLGESGGARPGLLVPSTLAWRGFIVSGSASPARPPCIAGASLVEDDALFTLDLPISLLDWRSSGLAMAPGWTVSRGLRACERYAGVAFRRYMKFLVSNHSKLCKMANRFEDDFRAAVTQTDRKLARSPLLGGFARLYAGGAMAIAAGVVPWQPEQLRSAMIACLEVAHRHAVRNVVSLTGLRQQLRQHVRHAELVVSDSRAAFGPDDKAGFARVERGERVYTIHAKTFRNWFADRAQRVAVLRWLHEAGHLRMGESRCRPSSSSTEWAERVVRWPGGRAHRSYVFRDPFSPAVAVGQAGKGVRTPRIV
jgi:hypothetical protein